MFEAVLQRLGPFAQEFTRHGKQLFLVGGAVRNLFLGRVVQDFDFATDALPAEVQTFFRRVLPTGLQHGTVTVLFQGDSYEVTTFRVDGDYTDGRRPDGVVFTPSLEEDLKRRDFTINALALNLADGSLTDPHDGRGDLERRLLRAIGDPGRRFDEDALRLLRLFRFASQLGFSIDPPTLAAVAPRRSRLGAVSRERIREELAKAMAGAYPDFAWVPLEKQGILQDLFAPLSLVPMDPAGWKTLVQLPPTLRWGFWLTAVAGRDRGAWDRALKALTFSNSDREAILGPPKAWDFLESPEAAILAAKGLIEAWGSRERVGLGVGYLRALEKAGIWKDVRGLLPEVVRVADSSEPVFLSELAVTGRDLLAAGVPPGPRMGEVLKALQKEVWATPGINESAKLLQRILGLR